ncbi:hypothetical protein GP486_006219, partial [Trichoglossum hirsutum]
MRYLDTDTLLCWAPAAPSFSNGLHLRYVEDDPASRSEESLRDMQVRTAKPIIEFLTTYIWPGIKLIPASDEAGILPRPQPEVTKEVISGWISGLPAFELAALERCVMAGKSLLVAVRLLVEWSMEFQHIRTQQQQQQQQSDDGAKVELPPRFGIEEAAEAVDLE